MKPPFDPNTITHPTQLLTRDFPDLSLEVTSLDSALTELGGMESAGEAAPPQSVLDRFLTSLRAHELEPGKKYVIFAPEETYKELAAQIGSLPALPFSGVVLPATFFPDGTIRVKIAAVSELREWLEAVLLAAPAVAQAFRAD
jgi:hypothetical protein